MEEDIQYLINDLSKVLAVLIVEGGGYTYVDRIGYAPSSDLAIFYIKEALRDYHSLLRKGVSESGVAELINKLYPRMEWIHKNLDKLARLSDRKELRLVVSLLASKAIALASRYLKSGLGGE